MSDLLSAVSDKTLLVTNLAHAGLIRLIELMDVPAICVVNGVTPEDALVDAAREHGAALLVSSLSMFETCGRLHQALTSESP